MRKLGPEGVAVPYGHDAGTVAQYVAHMMHSAIILSATRSIRLVVCRRRTGHNPTMWLYPAPHDPQIMRRDAYADGYIRSILKGARRVAVVGMSRSAAKAAGQVPRYLIQCGYDVIPVNPHANHICGRRSYPDISSVEGQIDIVDVFRPSDQAAAVVRQALAKQPGAIWLQEGIYDLNAEEMARQKATPFIYNRCMMVEHKRLLG